EIEKLTKAFGGIKEMNGLPAVIFIIDPHKEAIAREEANRLKIPIVAIADTNCNPNGIDFLIPGNDDPIKASRLFAAKSGQACVDGVAQRDAVLREKVREKSQEETPATREAAGTKGKAFVSKPEAYDEKEEKGS